MTIIWVDHYIRFEKWDSKLHQSSNLFVVTAVDLSCCWLERHCILLSIIRKKRVWSFTYVGYEFNVPVNSTQIGCLSEYGTYNCHDSNEKDSGTMQPVRWRNMTEREDHLCHLWDMINLSPPYWCGILSWSRRRDTSIPVFSGWKTLTAFHGCFYWNAGPFCPMVDHNNNQRC